jgi:hypothetical protein
MGFVAVQLSEASVSHDRDSAGPDYDELAPLDRTRNRFIGANEGPDYDESDHLLGRKGGLLADGAASDFDDLAPLDGTRNRFIGTYDSDEPNYNEPDHPLRHRFLDEDDGAVSVFDEPPPSESSRRRFLGAIAFVLLMAFIGSGAGVIWYFYGPQLMSLAGTPDVEKPSVTLGQVADEQRKLTQAIAALQLIQDALQKNVAAREQEIPRLSQEIQRLSAETRSLRTDLDALRSAAANAAAHPPVAQAPKSPPTHPPPKKKAERQPAAEPQTKGEPMALSPPSH